MKLPNVDGDLLAVASFSFFLGKRIGLMFGRTPPKECMILYSVLYMNKYSLFKFIK